MDVFGVCVCACVCVCVCVRVCVWHNPRTTFTMAKKCTHVYRHLRLTGQLVGPSSTRDAARLPKRDLSSWPTVRCFGRLERSPDEPPDP
jgi:hypothetical protein